MDGFQLGRQREDEGVRQDELVVGLGLCDRATLSDIENGRVEVTREWLTKAMGVVSLIKAMPPIDRAKLLENRRKEGRKKAALI